MPGIYIHIPFCTQKCGYCDFYSITHLRLKDAFLEALLMELKIRNKELSNEPVETIYFGGGTPSLLKKNDFKKIFNQLFAEITIVDNPEITIELNPDDISVEYLKDLRIVGFNRISIGIQSFQNEVLHFMNRRHNANQAIEAVKNAQSVGFSNISIDLIYGIPNMLMETWKETVHQAIDLKVQHISAYHLTFEHGTPFYQQLKKGFFKEIDDEVSLEQFKFLISELKNFSFTDYEISNFSLKGFESKHNSNYWTGKKYLGFGPSAHSFLPPIRRWNISDLKEYIKSLHLGEIYYNSEELTNVNLFNESIMLGLRTRKGVDLDEITSSFSGNILNHFNAEMNKQLSNNCVVNGNGFLQILDEKKFLTDQIIANFFIV